MSRPTSPVGLALALALLAAAGCQTPIKGHHEYDPEAPFASYRTWAWITDAPILRPSAGASNQDPRMSPIFDGEIRRAVERNLRAKGYEQSNDPNRADLVAVFSLGTREKVQVDSYPARAGYGYGWGGRYGYGGVATDVRTYTEGTLAIDFFDRVNKRAVWHGWATKRLAYQRNAEERREIINEATDAILEAFPHRSTVQ